MAWCRDPANQFGVFEPHQEFCWATYRLADHRAATQEKMGDSQRASVKLTARFREGYEPDIDAGLDLPTEPGDPADDRGQHEEEKPHLG